MRSLLITEIRRRLPVFASPVFVLALLLLIVNDVYLKFAFPGFITGKLSDFAGLFAFAFTVAAFSASSQRRFFLIVVALAFIWWKTEFSSPFLHSWNAITGLHWDRVQDFTDLIALPSLLLVLPALERERLSASPQRRRLAISIPSLTIAVLAFSATSEGSTSFRFAKNERVYYLPIPESDVLNGTHGAYNDPTPKEYTDSAMTGVRLRLEWDSTGVHCYGGAIVSVGTRGKLTRVALREVSVIDHCGRRKNKEWLAAKFETLVIEPLLRPKSKVMLVLPDSATPAPPQPARATPRPPR